MPYSQFTTFDNPDHYQAAVRGGDCEVLVSHAGGFKADLTRIDLDRLWMQESRSITQSPITLAGIDPERVALIFRSDDDRIVMHHNGIEISSADVVVHSRGDTIYNWASGQSHWSAMSLTHEDLAMASQAILGHALEAPARTYVSSDHQATAHLRALHGAACQLARTDPSFLYHPETVRALEQKLVRAMVTSMAGPVSVAARVDRGQGSKILSRFHDFLASKQYEPVYVGEICAEIGVSESTLRNCCHERLGMGPIHYLWLRRMHLARRSLLAADGGSVTVTAVATQHGFWELGRFSVAYRTLFGESPSTTLKRLPDGALRSRAH